MKWKCNVCNVILHSKVDEHANLLNGEYMVCPGEFERYFGDKDTDLSDVEKLDDLATKIMKRYSDKLRGLKRKNSLIVLAQKFNMFEKECLELSESDE